MARLPRLEQGIERDGKSNLEGPLMKQNGKAACRIFRWLLPIVSAAPFVFISCMWNVETVPVNQQLIDQYVFKEGDLKEVAFHVSHKVLLKADTTISGYAQSGNALVLSDERKDDVYSIPVDETGVYVNLFKEDDGINWNLKKPWKISWKKLEILIVSFDIKDLGVRNFEFIKNSDGFYQLRKNKKGHITTGGMTYTCLDGCNSLLMFKVVENDSYRGIDHSASSGTFFGKALLTFLILFAALTIFSR
jgi:hypothetical protein